jgi:hypothetical protein
MIAIVAAALNSAPLAVHAKSKNNSHSENGATSHHVSSGGGQAQKKAGQKQAKKKKKPNVDSTDDYLVIKLNDASVTE